MSEDNVGKESRPTFLQIIKDKFQALVPEVRPVIRKADEVTGTAESPVLTDCSFGRMIEFFSRDLHADLKKVVETIYKGPALPKLQSQIDGMKTRGKDKLSWDFLGDDDPTADLKLRVMSEPIEKDLWLIGIDKIFSENSDLRIKLLKALEAFPLATSVWAKLGFTTVDEASKYLAQQGIDLMANYRREAYKEIVEKAISVYRKNPKNEQAADQLRKELFESQPEKEMTIDKIWVEAALSRMGFKMPERFEGWTGFLTAPMEAEPGVQIHFGLHGFFEYFGANDELSLKLSGRDKYFSVGVHSTPMKRTNDPEYQMQIYDAARHLAKQDKLPLIRFDASFLPYEAFIYQSTK